MTKNKLMKYKKILGWTIIIVVSCGLSMTLIFVKRGFSLKSLGIWSLAVIGTAVYVSIMLYAVSLTTDKE